MCNITSNLADILVFSNHIIVCTCTSILFYSRGKQNDLCELKLKCNLLCVQLRWVMQAVDISFF